MSSTMKTGEVAQLLGTTKPTVRALIERGELTGTREPRGRRFQWSVDEGSVNDFLARHGRFDDPRRSRQSRLSKVEDEVAALREAVVALTASSAAGRSTDALDELRARVVNLQDAVVRSHAVAELQREAGDQRALVVQHLLAAMTAGENADEFHRRAISELQEALASFARPGHAGPIS